MSSGSSEQRPQEEPASGACETDAARETDAEGLTQATECPSCGTAFASDYCPECGQEANPSTSTTEVFEDFARELFDIERGFLNTLKALTLRPGRALTDYLGGARARLLSPGRYLLAAVILQYTANKILIWVGAQVPAGESSTAGGVPTVLRFANTQEGVLLSTLVLAGLIALLFRRLFGKKLGRGADATILSSFLVGHAVLLDTAVRAVWVPLAWLITKEPVAIAFLSSTGALAPSVVGVFFTYLGWAGYNFGSGWKGASKSLLGGLIAQIEMRALLGLTLAGQTIWRYQRYPESVDGGFVTTMFIVGAASASVFLLHAGVEAYCRLQ